MPHKTDANSPINGRLFGAPVTVTYGESPDGYLIAHATDGKRQAFVASRSYGGLEIAARSLIMDCIDDKPDIEYGLSVTWDGPPSQADAIAKVKMVELDRQIQWIYTGVNKAFDEWRAGEGVAATGNYPERKYHELAIEAMQARGHEAQAIADAEAEGFKVTYLNGHAKVMPRASA